MQWLSFRPARLRLAASPPVRLAFLRHMKSIAGTSPSWCLVPPAGREAEVAQAQAETRRLFERLTEAASELVTGSHLLNKNTYVRLEDELPVACATAHYIYYLL